MSTYVSDEVSAGLEAARKAALKRKTRMRVGVGVETVPILSFDEAGFTTRAQGTSQLRGLVDIYEGRKHLYQALIVTSEEVDDTLYYEFKRVTRAEDHPAADYVKLTPQISGLITAH